jgi:large subunit ribosomal protein L16
MLQPRKTRFRKYQKANQSHKQKNTSDLRFGECGIKSLDSGSLSAKEIETFRRILTRTLRRTGKVWIRIFPSWSVTKKPSEVRMGKGKGSHKYWVAKLPAGQVLFEMTKLPYDLATLALTKIARKTGLSVRLIWAFPNRKGR